MLFKDSVGQPYIINGSKSTLGKIKTDSNMPTL